MYSQTALLPQRRRVDGGGVGGGSDDASRCRVIVAERLTLFSLTVDTVCEE